MTNNIPPKPKTEKASVWKSIRNGFFFAIAILTIAYAFQVTKVDLEEFRKESRQKSRVRVMRALANPDLFEFERAETIINAPIYLPCPEAGVPAAPQADKNKPYVDLPLCGGLGETVEMQGFNFPAHTYVEIYFIPDSDPNSTLALAKARTRTDAEGYFSLPIELPKDRASDDVQYLRAYSYRNVGWPSWSKSATNTWDKIIETVFMAFLATLLGTILSFPLSFLAARNLMKSVKSPLTSIAFNILGWPLGMVIGYQVAIYLLKLSDSWGSQLWINLLGVIGVSALLVFGLRWFFTRTDSESPSRIQRAIQQVVSLAASILALYGILELGSLGIKFGKSITEPLGSFGFIGNFLFQSGDILRVITPAIAALLGGGMLSGGFGRLGQSLNEKLSAGAARVTNALLAASAGALLFLALGQTIDWFYEIGNDLYTLGGPIVLGALAGLALAFFTKPKSSLPIGMIIYYATRTIVNAVRSVEAVIMAIVFVIFVGIGPFAGVMALGLHTIASLVKLYSEQVESILAGPIEAIEATGANRLQTIIYAVIPQIIPPYISYTMYRWDINVRMSTIIGITGGGGIGFLLVQNINLLDYNAASTQMLAIAIVVASMDYISSKMREKYV
jgi:phosphonate ABC transporter permease subunit PhnE